ncbi:hypothetical protein, partial [Paenibacillus dendritiformis]|uniref:hypothetical protein n=1 Tax=Paenibacillus dendritiformis TaxID=130049 RepID=UPI001B2FF08D
MLRRTAQAHGDVSQALQNDGDDELTESADAGKTAVLANRWKMDEAVKCCMDQAVGKPLFFCEGVE